MDHFVQTFHFLDSPLFFLVEGEVHLREESPHIDVLYRSLIVKMKPLRKRPKGVYFIHKAAGTCQYKGINVKFKQDVQLKRKKKYNNNLQK